MMMTTATTAGCPSSRLSLPHVVIVTPADGSFVPHWCNRHRWTFSDPSPNYTLRTQNEPIKREESESMLPNRGESSVGSPVRYLAAVVLQRRKISGKARDALEQLRDALQTLKESCATRGAGLRERLAVRFCDFRVLWCGVWGANADEVFLDVLPQANCSGY